MTSSPSSPPTSDDGRLAELGYESHFKRDMSLWANFALGFTYLSPVVGIYVAFAISLAAGGPPMIWALVVAGVGQLLVALIFGEVVSQYPIAGGVYPWARRLWGKRWAWMTGWIYLLALMATIAGLAYGAGPYIAAFLGFENTVNTTIACAIVLLALALAINFGGTRVLSAFAVFGFTAELIGAVVVGGYLLLFNREHSFSTLFDSAGAGDGGSYTWAFLAAGLIGVYQYYGFEACGDVAEEIERPGLRIPKAMRMTIYVGGAAATFLAVALTLAVTDFTAVISGEQTDPITPLLAAAFGEVGSRIILGVVLISFVSGALSLMAATSRLLYSYARDDMIGGSRVLKRFSERLSVPVPALLVAAVLPMLLVAMSRFATDALVKILSFAVLGIYLAFAMVVIAALRARLRGWKPSGEFTLGRWGMAVNIAALLWGVAAMVNMVWPRTPDAPWYDNYVVLLSGVVVVGGGLAYMLATGRADRSAAPHGDAIPTERTDVRVPVRQ